MKFNKKDVRIETMRGKGNGGQHKNKTDSCVKATHMPTGLSVRIDGRKQGQNKKKAMKELERLFHQQIEDDRATARKAKRDDKIRNSETIRTYDYKRGIVTDHRTKKSASLKQIMQKGDLDLLRDE